MIVTVSGPRSRPRKAATDFTIGISLRDMCVNIDIHAPLSFDTDILIAGWKENSKKPRTWLQRTTLRKCWVLSVVALASGYMDTITHDGGNLLWIPQRRYLRTSGISAKLRWVARALPIAKLYFMSFFVTERSS